MAHQFTNNDLIELFSDRLDPAFTVEGIFTSRYDAPMQFAIRHAIGGKVYLIDQARDGSFPTTQMLSVFADCGFQSHQLAAG